MKKSVTQFCRLSLASWLLSFCIGLPALAQQNNMEQMLDQMSNSSWKNVPVAGSGSQMPAQNQMGTPPCYVPPQIQRGLLIRDNWNGHRSETMQPQISPMPQQMTPMQQQVSPFQGQSMPMNGQSAPMGNSPLGRLLPLIRAMNQQNSLPDQTKNSPEYKGKVQSALGAVKYELSNATSQASKAEFYCSKAGYGNDKGARRSNANEARYAANNARGCADRAYSRGGSIPECQSYVSQARAQANRAEAAANRAAAAVNW
ncbi:MAG: hypothetical protein SFY67_11620 [Candidatus Melainabacteria bacterium]|nr:hypothetical protein [Candidatus Melainabacteria bacterium]